MSCREIGFVVAVVLFSVAAVAAREGSIRLVSTFGPIDAGILPALEKAFTAKTGIAVHHQGAGTGEALRLAETGKFDLVLVHARDLEEKFVADGFGTGRYPLMYNDFVILGPARDPAGIGSMTDAVAALRRIADSGTPFVTRGDNSGTHVKELELWRKANVVPRGGWYRKIEGSAQGNAALLAYADKEEAYTIVDRATYITMRSRVALRILVERDESLLNFISLIPVNPARFPQVRHAAAMEFIHWLQSKEAQLIIRDFGKETFGEPLFFPNSPAGRAL